MKALKTGCIKLGAPHWISCVLYRISCTFNNPQLPSITYDRGAGRGRGRP